MSDQRSHYKWLYTPSDGLTFWATEGADGPPDHDAIGQGQIKGWAEVSQGETDKGKGEVAHITYDGAEDLAHDVLETVKTELKQAHPEAEIVYDATGKRRVSEYMGDNVRPGSPEFEAVAAIVWPLYVKGTNLRSIWSAVTQAGYDLSINELWEIVNALKQAGGQQSFDVTAGSESWQYAPGPLWFPQREPGVPVTHLLLNPDMPKQLTGYCGKQFIQPGQIVDENPTCMRCQWMLKSRGASYYEPQYPWIADTDGHTYLGGPGESHDLVAERHKIPKWRRQHEGVIFKGEVVHSTPMPPQAVLDGVNAQWAKDHKKDHETRKERGQFSSASRLMPGLEVEVHSYDGFQYNGRRGEVVSVDDHKGTALVVLHGDMGGTEFRINSLRTVVPDAAPWTQVPTDDTPEQLDTMVRNAAMSRTKRLEMATRLPNDQSQIVHDFGNGWTVRQLQTNGDRHREGHLMSNCWKFDPQDVPVDNLTNFMRAPLNPVGSGVEYWDETGQPFPMLHSLRDADNLPHVSFYVNPDDDQAAPNGTMFEMLGTHNASPKSEYVEMLRDYAGRNGLDFPGFVATSAWQMSQGSQWTCFSEERHLCPRCGAKMHSRDYCKACKKVTAASQVMYHVAPTSARESIQQGGLRIPSKPNEMFPELPFQHIWLWPDRATYDDMQKKLYVNGAGEPLQGWDTWKADVTGHTIAPDPHNWLGAVTTDKPIGPERLRLLNEGTTAKTAMAADPAFVQQWIAEHGPYLYHGVRGTRPQGWKGEPGEDPVQLVMREGLQPDMREKAEPPKPNEYDWTGVEPGQRPYEYEYEMDDWWHHPRPGHVFMTTNPADAYGPHVFAVDLRKLDPANLNPDDDYARDMQATPGVPDIAGPYGTDNPRTLGEQVEEAGWGDNPQHTHESFDYGVLAHRGAILPEALHYIDPDEWERVRSEYHKPHRIGEPHERPVGYDPITREIKYASDTTAKTADWEPSNHEPSEWASFDDTEEADTCPYCGKHLESPDYCKHCHHHVAAAGDLPELRFVWDATGGYEGDERHLFDRASGQWSDSPPGGALSAYVGNEFVGHVSLYPGGEIAMIEVEPQWRRRGVATALTQELDRQGISWHHSDERNENADAWINRSGGTKQADYGGGQNMPSATGVEDGWTTTDMHTHTFPEMRNAPMPAMDHPRQLGFDTSKTYWAYLDGEVAFGPTLHGAVHKVCVGRLDDTTVTRMTNLMAAGAYPQGMPFNIAAGVMQGQYPRIMATNVDRNAVYDAVLQKANMRRKSAQMQCDWCDQPARWYLVSNPSPDEYGNMRSHTSYACDGTHPDHLYREADAFGGKVEPYHPGQLFFVGEKRSAPA